MQKTKFTTGSESCNPICVESSKGNAVKAARRDAQMYGIKHEEHGYYVNTRAGTALFLRSRSDALWTSAMSVKRLLTILRAKGFEVRRVSIND